MKFLSVKIRNFMGLSEADLNLTEKGLVLIQGDNQDDTSQNSNGAGKSSLADAIFWGLYGTTARDGLKADEVINRVAKKNCEVTIVAQDDDGSIFTVSRWRKHSDFHKASGCSITHAKDGVTTDLTKGTDALTQPQIDAAIGCSLDVFTKAVYAGQEALPNLPAMGDSDLKKLIEEASGVTILTKAHDAARAKLRTAEAAYDVWRVEFSHLERGVQESMKRVTELKTLASGYDRQKEIEISAIKHQLAEALKRARERQAERDHVNPENVQAAIDKQDAAINAVADESEKDADLTTALQRASNARARIESQYQAAVEEAKKLKGELDTINSRVGTPCGTCGKPYNHEDIGDAEDIASARLRGSLERAKAIGVQYREAKALETAAQTELDAFRASKTDTRAAVQERRRLTDLLSTRRIAEKALESETAMAQRHKENLDRKTAEQNPYIDLASKAEADQSSGMAAYRASEEKGVSLEKDVAVLKDVVRVYGPAGVRAHILDTVTPMLNERTASYLGTLSDGRLSAVWATLVPDSKGDLKEKFSITVEKDGGSGSFAGLSGGEKRKVRIACALALQDLVASRATKPLRLMILDEVDTALDVSGLERLMAIFEHKGRETGTVLVISHSDLRDWIRETTTVTMAGGQATVSGILCEA